MSMLSKFVMWGPRRTVILILIENRDGKDHAMVLDFGIAKIVPENTEDNTIMIGTPNYMPPEQALGGKLDHRSDQYPLGIMLYEMITGEKPFKADTVESLIASRLQKTPTPREAKFDIAVEVENIIGKI